MLDDFIARTRAREQEDAERFAALNENLCQLCHASGPDMRSFFLDCGYAVHEAVEEAIVLRGVDPPPERGHGYYLRICKTCRSDLLAVLAEWAARRRAFRYTAKDEDGVPEEADPRRNVPVRVFGTTKMMTPQEYAAWDDERKGYRRKPLDWSNGES